MEGLLLGGYKDTQFDLLLDVPESRQEGRVFKVQIYGDSFEREQKKQAVTLCIGRPKIVRVKETHTYCLTRRKEH